MSWRLNASVAFNVVVGRGRAESHLQVPVLGRFVRGPFWRRENANDAPGKNRPLLAASSRARAHFRTHRMCCPVTPRG